LRLRVGRGWRGASEEAAESTVHNVGIHWKAGRSTLSNDSMSPKV
jgi:hypothetical protein